MIVLEYKFPVYCLKCDGFKMAELWTKSGFRLSCGCIDKSGSVQLERIDKDRIFKELEMVV